MSLVRLVGWRLRTLADGPATVRARLGAVVLLLVLVAALVAPLSGYQPGVDAGAAPPGLGPRPAFPLGTDHLGRDVFRRLVHACGAFTGPGLLACAAGAGIAVPLGALAGYHGGPIESALRYLTAVVASLPRFVLLLLVCAVHGSDLVLLGLVTGITYVPTLAEVVFARVAAARARGRVLAERAHGVPEWRILWVHLVLVGSARTIARHLLLLFAYFVVLESTLSYLGGLGVQEPRPSFGNMLAFEWGRRGSAVTALAPAAALWLTTLSLAWVSERFAETDPA